MRLRVAGALLAAVAPLAFGAEDSSLEAKASRIRAAEDAFYIDGSSQTRRQFGRQLETDYHVMFRPEITSAKRSKLRDEELLLLFDTMQTVAFFSEAAGVVKDMEMLFADLARRGLDTPKRVRDFHETSLVAHRFEWVRALSTKYRNLRLPMPPTIRDEDRSTVGRVYDIIEGAPESARIRALSLKRGARIVMLARPGCRPSSLAIEDIEADPLLRPVFEANAVLISPPRSVIEFEEIAAWNLKHPALRNYVAFSSADWPEVDRWRTPTFYFLKDGAIISSSHGWKRPDQGLRHRTALLKGMEGIGLKP